MSVALPMLDLADLAPPVRAPSGRMGLRILVVLFAALIVAGIAGGAWFAWPAGGAQQSRPLVRLSLDSLRRVEAMSADDRSQIIVEGALAESRNAAIPFAAGRIIPMAAFTLGAGAPSGSTALKCLTQAIYFEAANEPLAGRRAVAQVVLNRVRHPAYPKSVCGVVYQGAERTTGCQFSFTCDGSLLRSPLASRWSEAEGIARASLAGQVEAEVGSATHYHADYVLPKWAFQLDKVAVLGRHIFYRFGGSWGAGSAFDGRYSGIERIPVLDVARLRERLAADAPVAAVEDSFVPGLTVTAHVTDRHAESDVGGRLDTTREWRLTIPDPVAASGNYRRELGAAAPSAAASGTASTNTGEAAQ